LKGTRQLFEKSDDSLKFNVFHWGEAALGKLCEFSFQTFDKFLSKFCQFLDKLLSTSYLIFIQALSQTFL
jgi:hypothetical protein